MNEQQRRTVGEALVDILQAYDVEIVFGIPGVHTVELYRGLANSPIRHVTPRHEQGAGFMADGYARVSGKPGVCFVITGPGVTNIITAMAQAREDSVPMLVISGVNARATLGKGRGHLHELPDQAGMMRTLARYSYTLMEGEELPAALARAFAVLKSGRPGPVHIEIPTDVMKQRIATGTPWPPSCVVARPDASAVERAATLCRETQRPVIVAGGGTSSADDALRVFAEKLDAPVVLTTNARGLMAGHPLCVPASPSLAAVRALLADADLVVGVGTQFGPTDFDMYEDGGFPAMAKLVRIDVDAGQIATGPPAEVALLATARSGLEDISALLEARNGGGAGRARKAREAAWNELPQKLKDEITLLHAIRDAVPHAIFVGDSTQPVYAGNLYFEAAAAKRWFNSATGFGALGYGPPAAIGAAIAAPDARVICLIGDGGLQFSLAELGSAVDEGVNVTFVVWNNRGYKEIENFMVDNGIRPEGVKPTPPDLALIAEAYGLGFRRAGTPDELVAAVGEVSSRRGPQLVEYVIPESDH